MNRKTRVRIWWATAALSALLTACIGWVIFDDLFAPLANRGESVEIPDFCGIYYDSISIPDWMEVESEYRYDADVAEGIVLGIPNGGGDDLHTDDLACVLCHDQRDGAGAAVEIDHRFRAGEAGLTDGGFIELLGLIPVDLIKRPGRKTEPQAAQNIFNISGAEKCDKLVAKHRISGLFVDAYT